ncbi:hypothetical protein [Streptomyces roseolus]|uniref:hypothetical protein n=1 Tax=Streptomyces roseolus TaxID=67358 RepID=UPI0036F01918
MTNDLPGSDPDDSEATRPETEQPDGGGRHPERRFFGIVDLPAVKTAFDAATAPLREAASANIRFSGVSAELRAQVARQVVPDLSALAPKVDWPGLADLAGTLTKAREAFEAVALPGNWRPLTSLNLTAMTKVIEEGVPLAWVPPHDVILALVAAPDAVTRAGVLDANRTSIVDCCHQVLAEIARPDLQDQKRLLEEAAVLADGNTYSAAQALAASVWDTVYRGVWRAEPTFQSGPRFRYDQVIAKLPPIDIDAAVIEFRQACVFGPFTKACENFFDTSPVPTAYNRHATAHAAGATQYTPANALTALMLAVSLLRELEEGQLSSQIHS